MWPSQRLASISLKSWQGKAQVRRRDRRTRGIRPIVTLLEERTLLSTLNLTVTTLQDDPTAPIVGQVTLRDAIVTANASPTDSQENINFAAGLHGTIDLTQVLPHLANNININGPEASAMTVQRDAAAPDFTVLTVNSGETVNISGLTISGGNVGGDAFGGDILNDGNLMVNSSTITNGSAWVGGGIADEGILAVSNSTITNNYGNWGGGIYGDSVLTVQNTVFSGNSSRVSGGAVRTTWALAGNHIVISGSTFLNNTSADGGAIADDTDVLTLLNDTFNNNSANNGSAVISSAALGSGGSYSAKLNVLDSTFAGNISTTGGGAIYNANILTVTNTIVATNHGGDISGQVGPSSSNNLIGNGTGITNLSSLTTSNLIGTTTDPLNPLLGPLANNGGPTQTMALLPGSPAIDAGSNALAVDPTTGQPLAYDQRGPGFPRVVNGTVDIGAFESQGFTLSPVTGSTPQGTPVNSPFANPLAVIVTANNPLEPVAGGVVTFSAPASGPSGSLSTTSPVTIGSNGQASVTATANAIGGQYTVSASTAGAATPASFVLTNQVNPAPLAVTVTTLADDPSGSIPRYTTLRDAITEANAGPTRSAEITFAVTGTIDLTSALPDLANNISIEGPGATSLTVQRDQNAVGFSVFTVDSGDTVSISGITITGGNAASGGGIFNYGGTLMVTNCTITDNTASGGSLYGNGEGYVTSSFYGGGAIYSTTGGAITIANSTFTGNTTNGDGGGIYTSGTATVTNSVFTANEAACAGGIFNNGALTVNNSTFANSTGAFYGGGIWNASYDGGGNIPQLATLSVTNCTFTNNAVEGWASQGGGIFGDGSGTITVSNSTFANNSTNGLYNGGGGIAGGSPLTITNCTIVDNSGGGISNGNMTINNTIVAGNTGYDISGQITGDNNLIGNGTGITNLPLNSSNLVLNQA